MKKVYLSANDLLLSSYQMAGNILADGFFPDFIVAVWRGGTPVGIAVQELMEYAGLRTDHIAIRTSSYTNINEQDKNVRVHSTSYLIDNIEAHHKLLIVDDVFDSGRSIEAILQHIKRKARLNMPEQIRIAMPYFKPTSNTTSLVPDYFVHQTEDWIVFPHELCGLEEQELMVNKPELRDILLPLKGIALPKRDISLFGAEEE